MVTISQADTAAVNNVAASLPAPAAVARTVSFTDSSGNVVQLAPAVIPSREQAVQIPTDTPASQPVALGINLAGNGV